VSFAALTLGVNFTPCRDWRHCFPVDDIALCRFVSTQGEGNTYDGRQLYFLPVSLTVQITISVRSPSVDVSVSGRGMLSGVVIQHWKPCSSNIITAMRANELTVS